MGQNLKQPTNCLKNIISYGDPISFDPTKKPNNDDDCPICFDSLTTNILLQCPVCSNLVHTDCMKKWISTGTKTCVYCRSESWKSYGNKNNNICTYKNLLN